ncbi:hypothetical protein BOX15_Mlig025187g5, partial [Macrostomum lignano]
AMSSDQDEEQPAEPPPEPAAAPAGDASSSQEMPQPRRRRRRRSPSSQQRGPNAVQPVPPDCYIRRSLGSLTCCPDDSDIRRRLSEPSTAPSSAGAPLNLTSLLLHRRGLVRPKPGFLARFARQRPSDRDRRLLAGLAAAESSDPSSVYLSMLTCSFEFCRELFEPASGCDRLPQVGSAMTLPRGATTWGKYLADDPATFATMDQARWPVRGLCVVSDAYMRQLDSLMDESGGLLEGRAFLMQQPYRRLLGMRFGRPPPGFRPVELVDVRAERHEVLTVEEPILQPEQQPSKPSPAAVDQLVKEQPDLVDTDYCGAAAAATADTAAAAAAETADTAAASAASDADAIVGTGGASVFGKLLAMLNVKASSATPEQWDEFDAGFDCFDNPDAAARSAASYGFDDEKQLLRLQQRRRNESEGGVEAAGGGAAGSFEGLDFGLGFGGRRDRHGGAADEDDNDDEDEEGDGEEVGGSSGDEEPAAPLSVEEFSSQRALADYRLNELVSGLLASTSDRQFEGLWLARPWPNLRLLLVVEPPTSAAEEKAEDEDLPEQRRQRGRRVDLFLLLGYAQFCDKRVRRVHALLKRAAPDLRLPPTPEPLRPGLLDFDQLHERGLGCPDLLRWRLLPYDLTRCVAFVVLCCASVQPAAGCPFCSDSDTRSGADDFNCGGGGSRRRRIKVAESDGILRELTAHVMAKHTKLLRCHLCDGVNLFNHHIKLIQHMHYLHGFSDTGTHPCEACGKEFNSEYRLRVHLHNVHPVESHQCGLCGHHFKRLYLLRNHMAAVHKEPLPASAVPASASKSVAAEVWDEISCEVCKKVFSSERLLAVHRQRVHGQTSESRCFPCPHCQASLKGKQNLVSHIKQIHESPRVTKECPVCQKQVRNLSDHVISQHKVRLKDLKVNCHDPASDAYQCGVCTLSFRMQHLLLQHRRASHPQLTCHSCGRIFDSSEAADEHLLICSASGGGGADGERKRKRKAAAAAAAAAAASTTGEGGISGGGPGSTQAQPPGFKAPLPVADADPAAGPAGGSGAAVVSNRRTKRTARRRQKSDAAGMPQLQQPRHPQQPAEAAQAQQGPSASLKRKSRQPQRRSISSSLDSTASDRRADDEVELGAAAADAEDAAVGGASESPVQDAKRQRQRGKVLRKRRARTSAAVAAAAAATTCSSDEDSATAAKNAALADDDELHAVARRQQQKRQKPAAAQEEAEQPGLCFSQDADSEDSDSLQQQLRTKRRVPTSVAALSTASEAAATTMSEPPADAPPVESSAAATGTGTGTALTDQ